MKTVDGRFQRIGKTISKSLVGSLSKEKFSDKITKA